MEFLGTVEEVTSDGRLIVLCSSLPDIGDPVFDRRQNRVGTVGRILGPVDSPYASVSVPEKGHTARNTGLFFKGRNQNGKSKGRNRRNRSMS